MKHNWYAILLTFVLLLTAACGSVATPPPSSADLTAAAELVAVSEAEAESGAGEAVAAVPTNTSLSPTNTPAPPTVTPVPPTSTPAPPTEAPTEAPAAAGAQDPIVVLVGFANAERGAQLYQTTYSTNAGPYACNSCHLNNSESQLIGPGLLNVATRGATRVEGVPAEVYIYNSIIHPNDYVVSGFIAGLMPQNYVDLLSETDLYDLVAYLMTLQ